MYVDIVMSPRIGIIKYIIVAASLVTLYTQSEMIQVAMYVCSYTC